MTIGWDGDDYEYLGHSRVVGEEIRARDKVCIYCGTAMLEKVPIGVSRRTAATWEHIINDARVVTRENIALCCAGCNSSKGQKELGIWLNSPYCVKRGITRESIAEVAKQYLRHRAEHSPAQ